ncbi:MAG: M20/M25/M40 family metallo-hydrolase [Dysgonamonadaceae bacterium]|jgi:hypothetical protein|nr:M20/M25/M40 family metallo-hydrolase [Dysgonamonadaceae bacterium]
MKRQILFITLIIAAMPVIQAQTTLKERLEKHVYTLADDSLRGRKAGSTEGLRAANYIVNQWKEIGIASYKEDTYFQSFREKYQNIIGIIPGNDPALKDEYIVVGAHYDHLGFKVENGDTIVYNGADDNASGVATLIELARKLKESQSSLQRSVILIAFDAEEIGLFGSKHFADNPVVPIEKIRLILSVDMVGWHKTSGYVKYAGAGTIKNGDQLLLNEKIIPEGLHVTTQNFEKSLFTATDTEGFAKKKIPTLAVSTGLKSPYHKPEDDAHLIDYDGMALITEHLLNFIQTVSQDANYQASGKLADKHQKDQPKVWFGISAAIGDNFHYYTAGALDGKPTASYGIGLLTQLNMGMFAIRPEVYYEYLQAQHPDGKIKASKVSVPLNLVVQMTERMAGADFFIGGYYSYLFSGKQGNGTLDLTDIFYRNEGGLNYGCGLRVGPLRAGFSVKYGLTNFTRHKNADGAHIRNQATYFTLTYLF